jgi:hypothetical protein
MFLVREAIGHAVLARLRFPVAWSDADAIRATCPAG